jgi:hypothetical protein
MVRTDGLKPCASAVATVVRVRMRRVRGLRGVKVPAPLLRREHLTCQCECRQNLIVSLSECDIPTEAGQQFGHSD